MFESMSQHRRVVNYSNRSTRAIRAKLKLTQKQFSVRYHIPLATLRDWEQGRRVPDAPARALIKAIREEPAAVRRALARSAA